MQPVETSRENDRKKKRQSYPGVSNVASNRKTCAVQSDHTVTVTATKYRGKLCKLLMYPLGAFYFYFFVTDA